MDPLRLHDRRPPRILHPPRPLYPRLLAQITPLASAITSDYTQGVTHNELKRLLRKQGCRFVNGRKHTIVYLGDRRSTIPRHPSQEINPRTLKSILSDLGLKP
ncbi:MAG: type II toxin-antitoxin system HicA family toxin [Solibacteraceae bacterium]|nr:type II toxin-antitoxin system HicA family toxin [Solibacteraceae bacterium]